MSLQHTPQGNRLHIALFGKTNTGKSSMVNALTNQNTALVSPEKGTTTDPVYKAMELHPLGPCIFIDTAGFGDDTPLGQTRIKATEKIIDKTDVALLLLDGTALESQTLLSQSLEEEKAWLKKLSAREIPVIVLLNKIDEIDNPSVLSQAIESFLQHDILLVSAKSGQGIPQIRLALENLLPHLQEDPSICGHLVNPGDTVLLVMPQDIQAPKGRLILPQVQTIRDLLDNQCPVICVTKEQLPLALGNLKRPPQLIITDSQLFPEVHAQTPKESILTSFSVLFARYKGDALIFAQGAKAIDQLKSTSHILIAEACTHNALDGDIGRIKIPSLLQKKLRQKIAVTVVSGSDFPEDLTPYDLIIHCGSCMFNRRHVLSRIACAQSFGVPITNYGMAIAHMNGVLEEIKV